MNNIELRPNAIAGNSDDWRHVGVKIGKPIYTQNTITIPAIFSEPITDFHHADMEISYASGADPRRLKVSIEDKIAEIDKPLDFREYNIIIHTSDDMYGEFSLAIACSVQSKNSTERMKVVSMPVLIAYKDPSE